MPNNKTSSSTSNRRNWIAQAPIMRKGGVHDKTNKAKRQNKKQNLKKKLRAESFDSYSLTPSIMTISYF